MDDQDFAPFEPEQGTVAGTGLRYIVAGRGHPVVFVHGWGAFKEVWWGTLRALSPFVRAIALDLPGHGSPTLARNEPILDGLTHILEATCEELDLGSFTLVGHSLGGNIAARVALERPDLVSQLVLVAAATHTAYLSRLSRVYTSPQWGIRIVRFNRALTRPIIRWGTRIPHNHGGGVIRPWARRAAYMAHVEPETLHTFLAALYEGSLGERVAGIRQPTLIITGARDPLVAPALADHLAQILPDARLVVIPGAFHNPMDEQPTAFNSALLAFLHTQNLTDT
jgi:pimeloyl-ACP methyl ester carboxylesterase